MFVGAKNWCKSFTFDCITNLETGLQPLKANEQLFTIFGEKIILRNEMRQFVGELFLSPIIDPWKKKIKRKDYLKDKKRFTSAYKELLEAHKKVLELSLQLKDLPFLMKKPLILQKYEWCFLDEKELVIYPLDTKNEIKDYIKEIYTKNSYALLSNSQ